MQHKLILLIALVATLSFFACEDDCDVCPEVNNNSQIMFVYAIHKYDYYDLQTDERIEKENVEFSGMILGEPIPEFIHFKSGEMIFQGKDYLRIVPGSSGFGMYGDKRIYITSNFDPLDIEVKTSHGQLNGMISMPSQIKNITLSTYDTLHIGLPFTISWAGSNAKYYFVSISYKYYYGYDRYDYNYTYFDDFVQGNSITIPSSFFTTGGEISSIDVQAINGPFPKEGSVGNMTGYGSGFLSYILEQFEYQGKDIIVGNGEYYSKIEKTSIHKPNLKTIKYTVKERIENIILGKDKNQ